MKHTLPLLTALFLTPLAAVHAIDSREQNRSEAKIAAAKPNIIVIFTDDQTYRGVGYNNPEVKTPNLDALAASGITFQRGYVASPICAASRASMMTGRFPQQHGVMGLGHPAFAPYRTEGPHAKQALANRLAEAGYQTAFFGKSHLGRPKTYGFEVGTELGGHDDAEIFKQATAFLQSQPSDGKPFFLWLAPHQPHVPLLPEAQWLALYPQGSIHLPKNFLTAPTSASLNNQGVPSQTLYRDSGYRDNMDRLPAGPPRDEATMLAFTRAYHAVVSHLDDQVGRFAEGLRERDLLKNTVVFYLSDNGYHLGSHGLGNKITMHEESVRVPMFAFGAGIQSGQKTSALVSALDVYPTLIELSGASAPPESLMGKSLLPLFKDPSVPHRDTVFCECVGVGGTAGQGHRMARGDRWKLILSDANEEFLFDQQDDPFELTNRRDDPSLAPVLAKLRGELAAWMKTIGDRPYPSTAAPSPEASPAR
jgi:arylsulfatase A-like enzyme